MKTKALFAIFLFGATTLFAQMPAPTKPHELNPADVLESLRLISSYTEFGLSPEYEVKGERVFDGLVLAVNTLTLLPGSRLVFAGAFGDRSQRYITAKLVRIPKGPPPAITWARDLTMDRVILSEGRAASGSIGGGDGGDGTPGSDGTTGNPGYPGRSAPTIYLLADRIEGGPIVVDLRGQDGGPGGDGEAGGDGGIGRAGRPGISSLVDCRAGGGNGGKGGRGGNGGKGGPGGRGGNAGTLILLGAPASFARAPEILRVQVSGGKGGPGGQGGPAGNGGPGGAGGSGNGFCGGGSPGARGPNGQAGQQGEKGTDGADGLFATTPLTSKQLQSLIRGK